MASKPPPTIADLPNELLSHIISFLDTPAPSTTRLHDQPSFDLLSRPLESQHLKTASLVSPLWRAIALPLLFRHVLWSLQGWDLPSIFSRLQDHHLPQPLHFLRAKNLAPRVDTFILVLGDTTGDFASVTCKLVALNIQGGEEKARYGKDYNWLWEAIFQVVDPLRFTLVARPRLMAALFSRSLCLADEWSFTSEDHVVSLTREDRTLVPGCAPDPNRMPNSSALNPFDPPPPCNLFTHVPWTSVLINEGSQTRVYKTYEFFLKRPPSILAGLLGAETDAPNNDPLLGPYIRDFNYVGIFPLSSHFNTLVAHIPRLDRLFVQLVPRNDILDDRREMKHIDVSDLWMERNTAYSMLMRELFNPSPGSRWLDLKVFESGDSADKEAWDMAVRYVTRSPSKGWRVEREGVFVRTLEDENRPDQDGNGEQGQGQLHPLQSSQSVLTYS